MTPFVRWVAALASQQAVRAQGSKTYSATSLEAAVSKAGASLVLVASEALARSAVRI